MGNKKFSNNDAHNLTPWERYQQKQHQANSRKIFRKNKKIKPHQFNSHSLRDRLWFFIVLFTLLVTLLISLYFLLPISRIGSVKINGEGVLNKTLVAEKFKIEKNRSILNIYGHTNALEHQIKSQYPQLSNVNITITKFNHINISTKMFEIGGYLQTSQGYYSILENGFVLNKMVGTRAANLPIIKNFNNHNSLRAMLSQYKKLPNSIQSMILTISFSPTEVNPQRVYLEMRNKNQVYASIPTFARKMHYYPIISSKSTPPQVINFELGAYSYPLKQTSKIKPKVK